MTKIHSAYVCKLCQIKFTTLLQYNIHMREVHAIPF